MVYAKKTDGDGNVLSLYTYNFEPDFGGDGSMSIITKEEYDDILSQMPKTEKPADQISDTEALNIILGGADA